MLRYRNPTRSTLRTTVRSVNRAHRRIRWRTPDDLGAALAAWGRAVRAHRRLVRLAPRFFDPAVVDREAENRAEQRRWQATWEPDLARVYGVSPQAPTGDEETPRLPPHHIQHAVERQLAKWQFWMEASRAARKRHNQRHPHALRSLGRVARMMQLAIDFGNLAAGLDSPNSLPERLTYDHHCTDLKRAYGHLTNPTDSTLKP